MLNTCINYRIFCRTNLREQKNMAEQTRHHCGHRRRIRHLRHPRRRETVHKMRLKIYFQKRECSSSAAAYVLAN